MNIDDNHKKTCINDVLFFGEMGGQAKLDIGVGRACIFTLWVGEQK